MATTVKESFKQYASNLNITDRQETIVSNCRKNVTKKIGAEIDLHPDQPSRLIGSYDRDTQTRYLKEGDVDLMIVLNYGKNKEWDNAEGTSKALGKIKSILDKAYPETPHQVDRNCVTCKLKEFQLDVVPAFSINEGGYQIPDTYRKKWLNTDPAAFRKEVSRINKNMGGTFVPLIKMIKGWNREQAKSLRSFHLECLLVNHYKDYAQAYTYQSTAEVFLSNLPTYLNKASYDPISKDQVDLYLDNSGLGNKRSQFISNAKFASVLANEANKAEARQDSKLAIETWKELFGEFFPSYG